MYFDKICNIFPKATTHLLSQNSHFPLSLDMRIRYCWKAYWIKIPAVQTVFKSVQ